MSSLWPASDEITLAHDGHHVHLRPSLRAASIYAQEPGFETLFRRIDEFHLATVADIIMTTATDRKDALAFLASWQGKPLSEFCDAVRSPIGDLVAAFIPATLGQSNSHSQQRTYDPQPWPEAYRELYHHATGWLGWTPAEAWNATPTEINEAFTGHVAMLKAIHGGGKEEEKNETSYADFRAKFGGGDVRAY